MLLWIAIGATTCEAQDAPATWEAVYSADVLPADASPRWGSAPRENTSAEVTEDGLRIIDAGTEKGNLCFFTRPWSAEPGHGAQVEVTVKVAGCSDRAGVYVLIADGVHEDGITLFPDRVHSHRGEFSIPFNTTDDFHTYRLAIGDGSLKVWADGELVHDGAFSAEAHEGRNVVGFGSISSAATSEATWKSVKYALNRPPTTPGINAEHVPIYKKEGVYACFPSLVNYGDGKLGTSFGTRVRRSHIDGTGGSAKMISDDAGATWSLVESTPHDPWLTTLDGNLVKAYARGWRESPAEKRAELEARGFEVRDVREGVVAHCEGAYFAHSTDGGKTWDTKTIETPKLALLMGFNAGARLNTSKGVRLVAVYGKEAPKAYYNAFALRSEDDGASWSCVRIAGHAETYGYGETALCEAADGTIVAMMRTEPHQNGNLHVARSADGGLTWSPAADTGIWGHPANLLTLPDGRILCTYGYRRGAMGVRACLSGDDGKTWDRGNTIILRSDGMGNGGDLGYPITTLLPNGKLLTVYYITTADGITSIACTRWDISE